MTRESTEMPFSEWIGRRSEAEDIVTERLAAGLRATLGGFLAPVGEGEAPLGIHWCLAPAIAAMSELGPDGHPARNRDLPPVPQPRRMWAGGAVETHAPIRVGDTVRRVSTIADITRKEGRSGELWFVTVRHDYHTPRGLAVSDRQDIVYREAADPARATADGTPTRRAPATAAARIELEPTPTLLFRYSALTFNGHRIHYDLPYATGVEGYDGLVVHGPLQATLLYNLAAADGSPPRRFDYRGVSPAFAGKRLALCRGAGEAGGLLWTEGADGRLHMEARVAD